jgi:hypothetical protein
MANCSIPNSIQATGRISTRSSRRSKKPNDREANYGSCVANCRLESGVEPPHSKARAARQTPAPIRRFAFSTFHSSAAALQSARRARKVRRWMFDVRRSAFSSSRRVKGAWWPSRSSKPLSSRLAGRGRFDSYPLRVFRFDGRGLRFDLPLEAANSHQTSTLKHQTFRKGGDLDVA